MKMKLALAAAVIAFSPAAFAQTSSDTGRGAGDTPVGPASENGDNSTSHTKEPGAMGRSAYPDSARPSSGAPSPESAPPNAAMPGR